MREWSESGDASIEARNCTAIQKAISSVSDSNNDDFTSSLGDNDGKIGRSQPPSGITSLSCICESNDDNELEQRSSSNQGQSQFGALQRGTGSSDSGSKTYTPRDPWESPVSSWLMSGSEPTATVSPSQSDTTSEDFPALSLDPGSLAIKFLGGKGDTILGDVLSFFEGLLNTRMGIIQHQGQQQRQQHSSRNSGGNEQGHYNSRISENKRQLPDGQGGEEGDVPNDGPGNNGPKRKMRRMDDLDTQKVACPFMKRHPAEFSTWRTCVGPGFNSINRMKEHLKRRHFKERCCGRCGEQFGTNALLQSHMRAAEPCELREIEKTLGFITQLQWEDINSRRRGNYDVSESAENLGRMINCDDYETYLKRDLPRRILVQLNREFQIMAEHAKQRLAEIAREESVATLAGYLREKGLNSNASSEPELGAIKPMVPFNFEILDGDRGINFGEGVAASWPIDFEASM